MDSRTTVADVRVALARFNYGAADLLRRLNRVSQHYLMSDIFADIFTIVEFTTTTGILTVPREFGRIYGVQEGNLPFGVHHRFMEFAVCGIGRQTPSNMVLTGLTDMGSHFVTQADVMSGDVEQSGTLRVKLENAADAGKVIRFYGTFTDTDAIDRPVIDTTGTTGVNLTTVSPSADTTQIFKAVTGIQVESGMVGRWTLWKVISGVETQIGTYEPGELRPRYTRYKTRLTTEKIRCYCKRIHVPLVAETDWVYPDNLDAIEHGFNALTWTDKGDYKVGSESWEEGRKVLKAELNSLTPPPSFQFLSETVPPPLMENLRY